MVGVARSCCHYEIALGQYLRARRLPFVAINEARKTILPLPASAGAAGRDILISRTDASFSASMSALKSFDFLITHTGGGLLVDVKGRLGTPCLVRSFSSGPCDMLQNWVTQVDVDDLLRWEQLFGPGFAAVFAFLYRFKVQPPDLMFREVFEFRSAWYGLRWVRVSEYQPLMRVRSRSWRTVHVPRSVGRLPEFDPFSISDAKAG